MPPFKKSHCEHGKPGTRTRWRLWDKNDLNHSNYCQKTMMNDHSCDIRMWAQISFVLSQITRLTDGQTDGRTGSILTAIPCVALHAVARQK